MTKRAKTGRSVQLAGAPTSRTAPSQTSLAAPAQLRAYDAADHRRGWIAVCGDPKDLAGPIRSTA